jgi:hypothetical protein
MLGATVFNILMCLIFFVGIIVLYVKFLVPVLGEQSTVWGMPLSFVLSLALSFFAYRAIVKFLFKKIDMEKYFDPIFGKKRRTQRLD